MHKFRREYALSFTLQNIWFLWKTITIYAFIYLRPWVWYETSAQLDLSKEDYKFFVKDSEQTAFQCEYLIPQNYDDVNMDRVYWTKLRLQ